MKPASPPHLSTLVLLTAFSTLSLNMFLPSLANIARDLETDYATVSLAVSGYLAVTAVIQLIAGPLSDRIGRRPVLLGALAIFTVASVICAMAENIWVFLAFRMIQGGMIAGYALSLAIVRDTTDERRAAGLIGYISMAMAIAPMLGPMLGGVLDTAFGWRSNFQFYAISGALLLVLCMIDLGETAKPESRRSEKLTRSLLCLAGDPRFWAYALCTAFSTGAFYIFLTGAPLLAHSAFGVSTAELGILIGSITGGFMAGSFIAAKLAPRHSPIAMMLAGRCVACAGLLVGLLITFFATPSPLLFFGSTIFVGIGNGITMPSSNTSAMSVDPELTGSAAGLNGALTVACGALLTTFTGYLLSANAAPSILLALMLAASGAGLLTVLWALYLEKRQA